jgi:thioredoxin reductase
VYDVVIVGGGPAGLSAALVLGRCLRQVLVCDAGQPRNARARTLNGYLTRDGLPPLDFIALGRRELERYGVVQRRATVCDVSPSSTGFAVALDRGERVTGRSVLLATGVRDHLPAIDGVEDCYGISVHHCPYCDGWEVRGRTIVVIGSGASPAGLALSLKTWSSRVVACTNGCPLHARHRRQLADHDIAIHDSRVVGLLHDDGQVRQLVLADGARVACDAVFFTGGQSQQCGIAARLGCEFTSRGTVKTDHLGRTCVPGVYVVGDASRDVQFAIVAAAEGAKAGVAINKALQARSGLADNGARAAV